VAPETEACAKKLPAQPTGTRALLLCRLALRLRLLLLLLPQRRRHDLPLCNRML
jgi:hypothetical protein